MKRSNTGTGGEAGEASAGVRSSPSICIVSFSPIADDPRVRRQGDAFHRAGWTVTAVGLPGSRSAPPAWRILTHEDVVGNAETVQSCEAGGEVSASVSGTPNVPADPVSTTTDRRKPVGRLKRVWRMVVPESVRATLHRIYAALHRAYVTLPSNEPVMQPFVIRASAWLIRRTHSVFHYSQLLGVRFYADTAYRHYWREGSVREMFAAISQVDADIYLGNDWVTLPMVERAARDRGARFGYDTHEFALEEYRYRWQWRLFRRPTVKVIEGNGIAGASCVSCVSGGIARGIQRHYRMSKTPLVFRNVPDLFVAPVRPVGDLIDVVYHGLIVPDRGLEECVASVTSWREEFRFVLRGPISDEYRRKIETQIRDLDLEGRVQLAPPVPMLDLIRSASEADIGLSTPPSTSAHNVYALPNKFFEYIQAGLALCVANLPDMGEIVREHDLGRLIPEVTPHSIAQTINSFDRSDIERYKANSRQAARILCWEKESERLVGAYEAVLASPVDSTNAVVGAR